MYVWVHHTLAQLLRVKATLGDVLEFYNHTTAMILEEYFAYFRVERNSLEIAKINHALSEKQNIELG